MWQDRRGNWHLVYEKYVGDKCGATAYSATGVGGWIETDVADWYSYKNVALDGKVGKNILVKRERPQIVMDPDTGHPMTLFNGACTSGSRHCFNIAMPFN